MSNAISEGKATKIAIIVVGGNVTTVLSDMPNVNVRLVDYDNEPDAEEPSEDEYPFSLAIN